MSVVKPQIIKWLHNFKLSLQIMNNITDNKKVQALVPVMFQYFLMVRLWIRFHLIITSRWIKLAWAQRLMHKINSKLFVLVELNSKIRIENYRLHLSLKECRTSLFRIQITRWRWIKGVKNKIWWGETTLRILFLILVRAHPLRTC